MSKIRAIFVLVCVWCLFVFVNGVLGAADVANLYV